MEEGEEFWSDISEHGGESYPQRFPDFSSGRLEYIEEDVYNCRLLLFVLFLLKVMIYLAGQLKWFSTFAYRKSSNWPLIWFGDIARPPQ